MNLLRLKNLYVIGDLHRRTRVARGSAAALRRPDLRLRLLAPAI
jgi:hypothetical protein